MKYLKFLITGIVFGIVMSKAEIVSWYRIYEMFRFESFHMYGIIGSAVILGMAFVYFTKKRKWCCVEKKPITFSDKDKSIPRYLLGGIIFGLGWAMIGACPGPMFVLLGMGEWTLGLVIIGALIGTYIYGVLRNRLPH